MMTSSNGNIFRVTGPWCGEFIGDRWIHLTKASDAEFWCVFYLSLNTRLSKQSRRWWFQTPSSSLWRRCDDIEAETTLQTFPRRYFKCTYLNENVWISLKISLAFVSKLRINNIPALFQIMAWRRPGHKPFSETMVASFFYAYIRH